MTIDELKAIFEEKDDEFLKFDRVENKLSQRADLHAFILLDKLIPETKDILGYAEQEKIYLSIDEDALANVITEEQVIELIRCGVIYDNNSDGLCMFV